MNILTRVTELQTHVCVCFGFIHIFIDVWVNNNNFSDGRRMFNSILPQDALLW